GGLGSLVAVDGHGFFAFDRDFDALVKRPGDGRLDRDSQERFFVFLDQTATDEVEVFVRLEAVDRGADDGLGVHVDRRRAVEERDRSTLADFTDGLNRLDGGCDGDDIVFALGADWAIDAAGADELGVAVREQNLANGGEARRIDTDTATRRDDGIDGERIVVGDRGFRIEADE